MAILIKNKEDREKEAQDQDDFDAMFEASMRRKLNSLVRSLVNDFAILYATTGNIVNTSQYQDELETVLKQTYRRVNSEFSNTYLEGLEEARAKAKTDSRKDELKTIINKRVAAETAILASLIQWSQETAPKQSAFVVDTWSNIISKNVDDAMAENILADLPTDNATIAKKTKKPLQNELITHNEVIAMQEVQTATENAKFTEVDVLNDDLQADPTIDVNIEKTWITMGDLKVREAHMRANGQRRNLNDFFLVGGELLMYPKDQSGGASMGNIINCRCKSIYQ
jgi:hypothetical protein